MKASTIAVIIPCAVTAWAAAFASTAGAASIGVQFYGHNAADGTAIPSGTSAGVVSQIDWNTYQTNSGNNFPAVQTNLESDGSTSGMTVSSPAANGPQGGAASGNASGYPDTGSQDLFSGFISTSPGQFYVTLAGIPFSSYSLYVYADRSGSSATTETIGVNTTGSFSTFIQSATLSGTITGTSYSQGVNYVEFTGLTQSNLDIVASGSSTYLSGFQIVDTSTPEPASLGLLALGSLAMLGRRRRNV